jgi:DNA polymerase
MSASLDSVAKYLELEIQKGDSDALKALSRYDRRNGFPKGNNEIWKQLLQYNITDVKVLLHIFNLCKHVTPVTDLELHSKINQYGVKIDVEYVAKLQRLYLQFRSENEALFAQLTGLESGKSRSHVAVKRWLSERGLHLDSLNKDKIKEILLQEDLPADVVEVLKLRQTLNMSSYAKLDLVPYLLDESNVVRGLFVPFKAHTGRFAGRELQPHNFPKGNSKVSLKEIDLAHCKLEAERLKIPVTEVLATLLRGIFIPRTPYLGVVDYAQMELRCLAWFAKEQKSLDLIAAEDANPHADTDIYCETASMLFNRRITKSDSERQIGKIVELGCGYGMGAVRFGAYCKTMGIDLEKIGLKAEDCISTYRKTHSEIYVSWKMLDRFVKCDVDTSGYVSNVYCEYKADSHKLYLTLPSGRRLIYREVDSSNSTYSDGWSSRRVYGALLVENIIQAICRDMLVASMQQLQNVVLHIHDEICCELTEIDQIHNMMELICKQPDWCKGYPIKVEGEVKTRYSKQKQYTVKSAVYSKVI